MKAALSDNLTGFCLRNNCARGLPVGVGRAGVMAPPAAQEVSQAAP